MKRKSTLARAGLFASIPALSVLALSPMTAVGFEFPPAGSGLCLTFGAGPYFADVIGGVPGTELVVTNIKEVIAADSDGDNLSVVTITATVQIVDRSGTQHWRSDKLIIKSPDLATVFLGGGVFPDTYTFPGLISNTFANTLYWGGVTCYETIFAIEASGQKYLAVVLGFLTQTGNNEASGTDKSKLNIWILDADTGATVHKHQIRPVANKFLSGIFLSGIGGVDGDADDELVVVRANRGAGVYNLRYKTYDILNGAIEDNFSVTTKNTRIFN